jgi:DNA transposition AAA+ family ATPase
MSDDIEFVETSVSRAILDAVHQGCELGENVAIDGPAGCGKSFTLKRWFGGCGADPFRMFTVDAAIGGNTTYLLSQLCDSYGVSPGQHRALSLKRFISHAEDYFFCERQVIVFDEAQNMKAETVKDLANLSVDHKLNITFVFCGNTNILKTINTAPAAYLQRNRRINIRTSLKALTSADADAFSTAFGVDDAEARRMVRAIGQHFHADGIVRVLRNTKRLADGKPIRAALIQGVIDDFFHHYNVAFAKEECS